MEASKEEWEDERMWRKKKREPKTADLYIPLNTFFVLLENLDFNDFLFLIQNNIISLLKGKIAIKI